MTWTDALGWSLLHFLWEGAVVALVLAAALALLRAGSARVRYAVNCAALVVMFVCAVATFLGMKSVPAVRAMAVTTAQAVPAPDVRSEPAPAPTPASRAVADYMPALVWAWFGGVIALSIRSMGSWAVAGRFARRHTWLAEAAWQQRFATIVQRLRISRPVKLSISAIAQVPAVVGWLKPVVLVPAGVFAHLSTEQIEALLAHELAHVGRHDYLVNLLQTVAETLFFYHPAVWWVSRNIRNERENCCDDLAVSVCGDTVAYVRALTELEQMRRDTPSLAMAANGGSLLARVERLLRANQSAGRASAGWIAAMGIAVCILAAGMARTGMAQRHDAVGPTPAIAVVNSEDVAEPDLLPLPKAEPAPAHAAARHASHTPAPAEQLISQVSSTPSPAQPEQPRQPKRSWLEDMQAAGYMDVDADHLIELKIHGVTGDYIRQMRDAGYTLNREQLVAFRIHGVTVDYITGMKQAGLKELNANQLIALRIHGANPEWVRQVLALGYQSISVDDVVAFRIHGITPEFIRAAQSRGFKNLKPDQLIQLKLMGILRGPEII